MIFSLAILYSIKISEETLKFDNIEVNNKEFQKSKQPIDLNLSIVMMVFNILLVAKTKKLMLLDHYVLSYFKCVDA